MVKCRTRFDVFEKPVLICTDEGLVKQSFKDECDINVILKKYAKTGQLGHLIDGEPIFGDFSNSLTYHEACDVVLNAETQFMSLDAELRAKFMNDPGQFLAFVEDPKNENELVSMGLAKKRSVDDSKGVPVSKEGSPPLPADPVPGVPKA